MTHFLANDRPILILGNGPSAKLVDFDRLRDGAIHSIGMNAAYRHWDRIDFRPTHYICMDTVVIRSHAQRIAELIREGRISHFFLRNEFLELHPEFEGHERVLWFDDVRAQAGSIFDTHWITTGSWSIRWAASQGYRMAMLIGVDANYVELLPEAARVKGDASLELELTSTPRFNPNYFFADYQQAGDRYNVPNDPQYQQATGGLVHVDALRVARDDAARLGLPLQVVDCSPISTHGIFPKVDLSRLLAGRGLGLATSFYSAAPADEVANNARIAVSNARNPHTACVLILLEGGRDTLFAKLEDALVAEWKRHEATGRLRVLPIAARPDYLQLFEQARALGCEVCAVANSDILMTPAFTAALLDEYRHSERPFVAMTRWNRTARGLFIQGQSGHPPWQEVELEALDFKQRNFLSFDLYCFDRRTSLPAGLSQVLIGTFGCDTAIAALMRLAGLWVVNPCLTHRVEHQDEKVRNYSGEAGLAQMSANTEVVREALSRRFEFAKAVQQSLLSLEGLRPTLASVGVPVHRLGRWHSLFRLLGCAPWSAAFDTAPVVFRKVSLHTDVVRDDPQRVIRTLERVLDADEFLELEMGGANGEAYLGCFGASPELRLLRERLFRYDRQSVVYVDLVTDDERRIHADVLLAVRQCLTLGTGALSSLPGGAGWHDLPPPASALPASLNGTALPPPRLLIIDPTPVGHPSATGQIKAQFLRDHPRSRLLQVCAAGHDGELALWRSDEAQDAGRGLAVEALVDACERFRPDVVYCRPVDSLPLLEFAVRLVAREEWPLVVHVMDDWPERARRMEVPGHRRMDELLRRLIARATVLLSISEPMSQVFGRRYSGTWTALANGVDVQDRPFKAWERRAPLSAQEPFLLRFLGGFAPDMGADSIIDVARVVSRMAASVPIRFEVFTMPWYLSAARKALGELAGVTVAPLVAAAEYPQTLADADALLVAYNFDENSLAYCGLSMGNKMPECLAAGVPVLAYGPPEAATIAALASSGGAEVVSVRDDAALRTALERLTSDLPRAARMGLAGRTWVARQASGRGARVAFRQALLTAMKAAPPAPALAPVLFDRGQGISARLERVDAAQWRLRVDWRPGDAQTTLLCLVSFDATALKDGAPRLMWNNEGVEDGEVKAALEAGEHWVMARHTVTGRGYIVLTCAGSDPAMDVAAIALYRAPFPPSTQQPRFTDANRRWRHEGPAAALPDYLALFMRDPLPLYARNALLCARAALCGSAQA